MNGPCAIHAPGVVPDDIRETCIEQNFDPESALCMGADEHGRHFWAAKDLANDCDHRGGAGDLTITRDTAPASGASLGSPVRGGESKMPKWNVCIRTEIVEEVTVEAESELEALKLGDAAAPKKIVSASKSVKARQADE